MAPKNASAKPGQQAKAPRASTVRAQAAAEVQEVAPALPAGSASEDDAVVVVDEPADDVEEEGEADKTEKTDAQTRKPDARPRFRWPTALGCDADVVLLNQARAFARRRRLFSPALVTNLTQLDGPTDHANGSGDPQLAPKIGDAWNAVYEALKAPRCRKQRRRRRERCTSRVHVCGAPKQPRPPRCRRRRTKALRTRSTRRPHAEAGCARWQPAQSGSRVTA